MAPRRRDATPFDEESMFPPLTIVFFRGACFQSKEQDIDALCTAARTHFNLKSRQFSLYAWKEKDNDERLDVRVDTNEALEALSIDGVTKLRVSLDGFMQLPQSPPPLVTKQPRKDYVAVRVWKADGTFEAAFYSLFDVSYYIDEECDDEQLAYTLNDNNEISHVSRRRAPQGRGLFRRRVAQEHGGAAFPAPAP